MNMKNLSIKFKALIGLSLLTVGLGTGCSRITGAPSAVTPEVNAIIFGSTQEFQLKDGTRCVTWKENNAGGITCDWRK